MMAYRCSSEHVLIEKGMHPLARALQSSLTCSSVTPAFSSCLAAAAQFSCYILIYRRAVVMLMLADMHHFWLWWQKSGLPMFCWCRSTFSMHSSNVCRNMDLYFCHTSYCCWQTLLPGALVLTCCISQPAHQEWGRGILM